MFSAVNTMNMQREHEQLQTEIKAWLQGEADPSRTDRLGNTLLMRMVWHPRYNSYVRSIAEEGTRFMSGYINLQNRLGKTAVVMSIENGNMPAFYELVKLGADLNIVGLYGNAFDVAFRRYLCDLSCESRSQAFVNVFIKAGFNLDSPDRKGLRPLMRAVHHGNIAMVKTLIRNGCDVNAQCENEDGPYLYTPLHFCCARPQTPGTSFEIFKTLLLSGANPDIMDTRGRPPLVWTLCGRQVAALCFLLRLNCRTAFTYTCDFGRLRDTMADALLVSRLAFPRMLLLAGYNQLQTFVGRVQQMEQLYANTPHDELLSTVRGLARDASIYERVLVDVPTPDLTWLYNRARTPTDLQQICRQTIRNELGRGSTLISKVKDLPLPTTLKKFLLLADLESYGGTPLDLIT